MAFGLELDHEDVWAPRAHRAAHVFRRSANGVWLAEAVPAQFIDFPETGTIAH
jgi:RNA:NAD 2'-phosphotransferase (TPT1/KptA family)